MTSIYENSSLRNGIPIQIELEVPSINDVNKVKDIYGDLTTEKNISFDVALAYDKAKKSYLNIVAFLEEKTAFHNITLMFSDYKNIEIWFDYKYCWASGVTYRTNSVNLSLHREIKLTSADVRKYRNIFRMYNHAKISDVFKLNIFKELVKKYSNQILQQFNELVECTESIKNI